jgi:antitoxin (DNA-binding transcriptional repressor) of toxin-antitoxin stability system
MKRITASEARRTWFRLLDEVAGGATVAIERHGTRVILTRETEPSLELPDYSGILRAPSADRADRWGWRWEGEGAEIVPEELD